MISVSNYWDSTASICKGFAKNLFLALTLLSSHLLSHHKTQNTVQLKWCHLSRFWVEKEQPNVFFYSQGLL